MAIGLVEDVSPKVALVAEDKENLESSWHRAAINLLIEIVSWLYRGRSDFYAGGNMFVYYSVEQARNRDFRGPDFFFVKNINRYPLREYWAVWDEGGRYPNVVIELLSPTTAEEDRTTKKDMRVFFTPMSSFVTTPATRGLEGWRLIDGAYQPIEPNEHGWLWCKELELWLGTWRGKYLDDEAVWLRFYHVDGTLASIGAEALRQQSTSERQLADAAEAELARLTALLAQQKGNGNADR